MRIGNIEFEIIKDACVEPVMVTPEAAAKAITAMADNQRAISPKKVNEWAKEMSAGKWMLSNDAAVVCRGEWLNAQHRFAAIVQSGKAQPMLILDVQSPSIMRVIDGGHPRRVSDVLKMETGMPYSKDVTAIADKVLAYDRGILTSAGSGYVSATTTERKLITRQERIAYAEKCSKRLIEIITQVRPWSEKFGPVLSVMLAGAAWYIIERSDGEQAAMTFVEGMFSGENLSGAQKVLRSQIIRDATARKRLPVVSKFGLVLKAYLSHRNGTVPGNLALRSNEEFPRINKTN